MAGGRVDGGVVELIADGRVAYALTPQHQSQVVDARQCGWSHVCIKSSCLLARPLIVAERMIRQFTELIGERLPG